MGEWYKGICYTFMWKRHQYREYVHEEREENITLKSGCSFKVKSYLLSSKHWSLNVVNGEHNYDMTQYFQGHKYVKRLRSKDKELVCELTENIFTMHVTHWRSLFRVQEQRCNISWSACLKASTCVTTEFFPALKSWAIF
jgi:hypothetical protein